VEELPAAKYNSEAVEIRRAVAPSFAAGGSSRMSICDRPGEE